MMWKYAVGMVFRYFVFGLLVMCMFAMLLWCVGVLNGIELCFLFADGYFVQFRNVLKISLWKLGQVIVNVWLE